MTKDHKEVPIMPNKVEKPTPIAELVIKVTSDYLFFYYASPDAKATVESIITDDLGGFSGDILIISPVYKGKERELALWICYEAGGVIDD